MINRLVNKILKSINNLPAEYKVALARILTGIIQGLMTLEEKKVDKEEGKDLSTNDFTDELKEKLENLPEEFVQENADWNSDSGSSQILNKPDLTVYPDSAEWSHEDKKIYFKHQGTIIDEFTIDGADFVKDGMIEDVKIENNNLVIKFNTDHGKEDIEIPLSEIFNPDNYYTKIKTDELFVKKVTGKQLSTNDFTDEFKHKLENLKEQEQSDWNENNENKISYIKNRTHWKESGEILDNIIKIYDSIEHTNEHLIAEYTPIEFREVFAQIIYNKINNIQIFEDIVFPVGYFKPVGADWQNYNLYFCIIHFNGVRSNGLIISVKYFENSEEVNEEYLIDNTLSAIAIKQQLENTMFTSNNWSNVYGFISLYNADIEECTCKKAIADIIYPLDSKYLEDLTDEEINEILE